MFTSLIVQIRPVVVNNKLERQKLVYIPHSSDKTIDFDITIFGEHNVYIPHSSDKTSIVSL